MKNQYWHIEGFDSTVKIYDTKVKLSVFSEKQIQSLLKTLAAKSGLNYSEIIGAYASKRAKIANNLLKVHKEGPSCVYSCGDNPHFLARIVHEDE